MSKANAQSNRINSCLPSYGGFTVLTGAALCFWSKKKKHAERENKRRMFIEEIENITRA